MYISTLYTQKQLEDRRRNLYFFKLWKKGRKVEANMRKKKTNIPLKQMNLACFNLSVMNVWRAGKFN